MSEDSLFDALKERFGKEEKKPYPGSFAADGGDDPRTMEGVYAGPPIPPMEPVYAGPEFMNDPNRGAYVAPQPSELSMPSSSEMMMVYAGPDYFSNNRNSQTPMMVAYAGPMMNGPFSMAEQMEAAKKAAEEQEKNGSPLPGTLMVRCSCCGSVVPKGVFCCECGYLFPKDEESGEA